jgi:predicted Zn-dependent protease
MLALAAMREKNPDLARLNLRELVEEFPENPLFASELAKITPVIAGRSLQ